MTINPYFFITNTDRVIDSLWYFADLIIVKSTMKEMKELLVHLRCITH